MLSNRPIWASKILGKMKEQGKTQGYMSDKLRVSQQNFSRIINGKTEPFNVDQCCEICNDLGVTLNDIFLK